METVEEYIPRSAWIKFELIVTKDCSKTPEFKNLAAETDKLVQDFRLVLKNKVIAALKLERINLHKDLMVDFVKSLRIISDTFYKSNDVPDTNLDDVAIKVLTEYSPRLLKYCECTLEEMKNKYFATHEISDSNPVVADSSTTGETLNTSQTNNSQTNASSTNRSNATYRDVGGPEVSLFFFTRTIPVYEPRHFPK